MVDVSLDGVTKAFGATTALDDVSLDVRDGEFFTLVGPSGCGKTTTLRAVAGFEEPTAGAVRFDGENVTGVPVDERDVGIVFQNYALFPHMTVGENVAYGLRFRDAPGGASRDERVAELLDLVDLSGFEERDPAELSGGQQQRVALARALAPGPSLLLLDEPMSALDARLRETLRRHVKRIQRDLGITTIYVTHDQEEALSISDRLAVMNDGRVEQVGTPQAVYRAPESRFVAEFVGDNNVLDGTVTGREGGVATVDVDGETLRLATPDGSAGDRVTFCVRPERLIRDAASNRLDIDVDTAEFLGETTRVYGTWNDRQVVVRLDDVPETDTLTLGFAPEDATVL
ncbi:ABC transporter ATP-binding protein [Salarchaeum japonicum]|uniref:Molybdate/tungstate import ATP-binding protein WtpC n=1 Tax=Salarchaeum japonicum TaxID=555573 RepID=A0AAV3T0V5_9EURY|nr:ABC transporter ATP-binding protein [Salarchaeum japonicum]